MAKKSQQQPSATITTTQVQYHCRCYKVGTVYEMWVLDPASGTYNGPIPCTKQQCRSCNMSEAEIV